MPTAIAQQPTDAISVPCTVADIQRVRKEAEALVAAGDPERAIAKLQAVECWLTQGPPGPLEEQIAWRISDLAFAEYKAGRYEDCYGTAEGQTAPYTGNVAQVFGEDAKVLQAISYNADLCRKAAEKKRGAFIASTECYDGDSDAKGIPPEIYGARAPACIVLGEAIKNSDGDTVCGTVSLNVKGQKKRTLAIADADYANLSDPGVCCNISDISFAARPKGFAMLVVSGGRNCDGGTAQSSEEHVYELQGSALHVVSRLDAHYH